MAKEQNIDYALRVAYMSLLDGNISVGSVNVPGFKDGASIGNEDMYFVIQAVGSVDNSKKVGIDTVTSTLISLYAKGEELDGTEIEDMAAQILAIVSPYNGFVAPVNSNFRIIRQKVISDTPAPVLKRDTTVPVYERNIIIQHEIIHTNKN